MLKARMTEDGNGQRLQRRGFDRAAMNIAVIYSIGGDAQSQSALAIDLSGSGIRISTGHPLTRGAEMALEFCLPNSERAVAAQGRLVMSFFDGASHQYSHGIAFTQISKSDQEAIVACVQDTLASK